MATARLALLVFTLAACVRRPPVVQYGTEGPLTNSEEVLARVEANEKGVRGLSGEGRLTIDSPQGKGTLTMLTAVAPGAKLHLEMLDFFGRPQAVLVTDGARFGLFQAQEGRYYQGPATPRNLALFLPVAFHPEELEALLLGRVPRLRDAEVGPLVLDPEEGAYRIVLSREGATQTIWVDTLHLRVRRSEVRGARGYDLRLEDFFEVENRPFPRQVTLRAEEAKTTLSLRYGDVTLEPPSEPGMFVPRPPANVPTLEVDEHGAPLSSPSTPR